MDIRIKKISKEKLETCGWKYEPKYQVYHKIFNECNVFIRFSDSVLRDECWTAHWAIATPDDLIAIANELKKLEEN